MPNHAQNHLLIECQPSDFATVRALLAGPAHAAVMGLESDELDRADTTELSFYRLRPVPPQAPGAPLAAAQELAWGVRCGAYAIDVSEWPEGLLWDGVEQRALGG